jgi:hypothetical protein
MEQSAVSHHLRLLAIWHLVLAAVNLASGPLQWAGRREMVAEIACSRTRRRNHGDDRRWIR